MKSIQLVTYSLNRVKTKIIKQTHHHTDIIYKLEIYNWDQTIKCSSNLLRQNLNK